MPWTIEYDVRAVKELKKIDRQMQRTILDYLDERIAPLDNPRKFGKRLSSNYVGLWRYRIGDYRVICRIEDQKLAILVLRIRHRGAVYGQAL